MGERLYTVNEAATKLNCHPETIRRAVRSGRLACYRALGRIRIDPTHLQAMLDASECLANDQSSLTSKCDEGDGQSSGGSKVSVAAFRRERRMTAALDRPSRISKPSLNVVR